MKVLLAERVILNVLSFDLIIEQPFNAMIFISTELSISDRPLQYAWRFANDSVLTTVSIQYSENTIAAACMYLSISGFNTIPKETYMPVLLSTAQVTEDVVLKCANCMKALYQNYDILFQ
ncbi:cyclin [Blastocystis sp. subtype 4]|uniref:cyclin n=1 Tax=Blastocystis sp. subtype 4 TaxID=944170 RepID=UPI0007120AAB|nr:cyclin [Blastocystis sp. subtype 4]KNB43719.1 cyclin [Blastocystis sp. subtype 4]|eukprot:XP_014527162.1 cyclin [Blastocystis sp. subtype 4]